MNSAELQHLIQQIDNNSSIQLLEPLSMNSGFFATEGKLLYMSLDSCDYSVESIDTDFLTLQMHVPIHAIDNSPTFNDGFYNIVIFKGSLDDENADPFIELCSLHASHQTEIAFRDFFYALISLFQLPREQSYKNAVGLFGELKYMQYIAEEYGVDISLFWHKKGSLSKFDFSNKDTGIEIKTTSTESASVLIKHNQIFGDYNCFLVAVECDQIGIGESLSDLIDAMKNDDKMFKNLNFAINLEKELKRVSPQQINDLVLRTNSIITYNANCINPFSTLPDNIDDLSYKLDLSDATSLLTEEEQELISDFVAKGE